MKFVKTHGMSKDPQYKVWTSMKCRCNNPNDKKYHLYGGKGVKVCERWEASFQAFVEDMGPHEKGMTIDRLNPSLGYNKENCVWATFTEQNRHLSCTKLTIEIANKIRACKEAGASILEAARLCGVTYQNSYDVLVRGRWAADTHLASDPNA